MMLSGVTAHSFNRGRQGGALSGKKDLKNFQVGYRQDAAVLETPRTQPAAPEIPDAESSKNTVTGKAQLDLCVLFR